MRMDVSVKKVFLFWGSGVKNLDLNVVRNFFLEFAVVLKLVMKEPYYGGRPFMFLILPI